MSTKDSLVIAVPNKGRLQDATADYFSKAGFEIEKGASSRDYTARLAGIDNVSIAFLSAGEIATSLAQGRVHLGVTGEDLLREDVRDFDASIHMLTPLGFGGADVVVAVPQAWLDVSMMADLDDVALAFHNRHRRRLRVATKYVNLTMAFFARHEIGEYRIVESMGATEAAPSVGLAEIIVDITSTGSTLKANKLKLLDDGLILKSQAWLSASTKAAWSKTARSALEKLFAGAKADAFAEHSGARDALMRRLPQ